MEIKITELQPEDINKAKKLAKTVIPDNFQAEGATYEYQKYLLKEILRVQNKFVQNQKENYYFLVAKDNDKVIGVAGYGFKIDVPIKLALNQLQLTDKSVVELISFYIHPQYQGKGFGSKLLQTLLTHLKHTNYQYFSLYTGYHKAKDFWKKKLGEPTVVLPKYFEGKKDCDVWVKPI